MISLLPTAAAYSRSVISNFPVGAVALSSGTENMYLGASMESANESLTYVTHGEQSAMNNA
ncbi:MAG: hypothetical protein HRU28_08725 [Rhizobiales bacterium]|nr:hypothetical protein [Hyphomicrobiales bacterium]